MNSEGQSEGNRGTERHRFLRWASIAALLVCWQVIAMLAESELLPLPGAVLGVLLDVFGNELTAIRAPFSGIVNYVISTPPVSKGEPVAMISKIANR